MKKLSAVLAVAAIAATIAVWAPWASSAGPGSGSPYEPVLDPANFTTTIDNPYFPLPVGRTLVYRGVKDGQTQEDRVTVTDATKTVAEGITARVVTDVATHDGALLEKTSDWYAQDNQGNAYRQEFLAGQAEDTAWIVDRGGSTKVPYGPLKNVLTTLEATHLEPGAYDLKVYAPGIGIAREQALTGTPEFAELVSVTG